MKSFNEKYNWCDDKETLANYFNNIARHVAWELFQNQEDWLYMAGELGKGAKPKIKSMEKFEEAFSRAYNSYVWAMKNCMMYGMLKDYIDSDIDIPEDVREELVEEGYLEDENED